MCYLEQNERYFKTRSHHSERPTPLPPYGVFCFNSQWPLKPGFSQWPLTKRWRCGNGRGRGGGRETCHLLTHAATLVGVGKNMLRVSQVGGRGGVRYLGWQPKYGCFFLNMSLPLVKENVSTPKPPFYPTLFMKYLVISLQKTLHGYHDPPLCGSKNFGFRSKEKEDGGWRTDEQLVSKVLISVLGVLLYLYIS